jgi:hypothetical protein
VLSRAFAVDKNTGEKNERPVCVDECAQLSPTANATPPQTTKMCVSAWLSLGPKTRAWL